MLPAKLLFRFELISAIFCADCGLFATLSSMFFTPFSWPKALSNNSASALPTFKPLRVSLALFIALFAISIPFLDIFLIACFIYGFNVFTDEVI